MLFNSFEFIFIFLPLAFAGYFILNKVNFTAAKVWLLLSSLFFYSWWNPKYLPLILVSMVVNFTIGYYLGKYRQDAAKKLLLITGILFNLVLLGFFKYYDFFITNLNTLAGTQFNIWNILLPLAISFYTFQQIAYLVDSYKSETREYNFLNYALFVSFFPQLIAGPIVHHSDVMSQYQAPLNKKINWKNISMGVFIFSIGLFKKVGIADTLAVWANKGYASAELLTFLDGWLTSLAYTFQLYFDFSGYTDMALGAALLFNIKLPMNFNSPYKAVNIQDFWKRWHITLSHFLTRYIYIPLGGNKITVPRTYFNILLVFFISGLWHGAGWTFVVWGLMHGLASVFHRAWKVAGLKMNALLGWFLTFQFVNVSWVFFRAPDFKVATEVLQAMTGLKGIKIPESLAIYFDSKVWNSHFYSFPLAENVWEPVLYVFIAFLISVLSRNSLQMTKDLSPGAFPSAFAAILFLYSVFHLQRISEFLYFNF